MQNSLQIYVRPEPHGARCFWRGLPRLVKMICPSALWDPSLAPNSHPQPRGARGGAATRRPSRPRLGSPKSKKSDPEFQDLGHLFFLPLPGGSSDEIQKVGASFHFSFKSFGQTEIVFEFRFFSIYLSINLFVEVTFFSNFGIGIPKFRWTFSGRCKPFRVYHSRGTLPEADFRYTTILAGPWAAAQRTNRKT